jgi:hypothetical protein
MKKLIVLTALLLGGLTFINAQPKGDKEKAKMFDKLNEVCALSPEQDAKIKPLISDFVDTKIANKQKYGNDVEALKEANKSNRKNYMEQAKAILTPEQQAKWKTYMEEQKRHKTQGQGEGQGNENHGGEQ